MSAYALHDGADDVAGPVLGFSMGDTLALNEDPLHLDSDIVGNWSIQGIATGLTFRQTNPVSSNASD